jgi:hypothetical protein
MRQQVPLILAGIALSLAACTQSQNLASAASGDPAPLPTTQPAPPSDAPKPQPGAASPAPDLANGECGADKLADYVNQLPSSEAMSRIRAAVGHDRIRTIRPGDAVTMDFRPDRLNIEIGEDGRIKLFRCG